MPSVFKPQLSENVEQMIGQRDVYRSGNVRCQAAIKKLNVLHRPPLLRLSEIGQGDRQSLR